MTFFFDIYFASDSCVNSSLAVSRQEQAFFHHQKTGPILELVKQQWAWRFLTENIKHWSKLIWLS